MPHGGDAGGRGSLEVFGVYLDLNRETLDLLEMNQDLDVVLKASDLPGAEPARPDQDGSSWDERDSSDIASDPAGSAEPAQSLAEADNTYRSTLASIDALRSELERVESHRRSLAGDVDAARGSLDSFAVAGLTAAREELAALEAAVARTSAASAQQPTDPSAPALEESPDDHPERVSVGDVVFDQPEVEQRVEELISESNRLKSELKRLRSIDPEPVDRALRELTAASRPTEPAVSPEAEALAREWNSISEQIVSLSQLHSAEIEDMAALVARRDEAYSRLAIAQDALRSPSHDPAAIAELESIHDEIFEIEGKGLRLGAAKIRRRQEELRAQEAELLERLGFDTWTTYVMGAASADVLNRRRGELEAANVAYEEAEAKVTAAQHGAPSIDPPDLVDARPGAGPHPFVHLPIPRIRPWSRPDRSPEQPPDRTRGLDDQRRRRGSLAASGPARHRCGTPGAVTHSRGTRVGGRGLARDDERPAGPHRRGRGNPQRHRMGDRPAGGPARGRRSDTGGRSRPRRCRTTSRPTPPGAADAVTDSALVPAYGQSQGIEPAALATPELLAARLRVKECERRARGHEDAAGQLAPLQAELERLEMSAREIQASLTEREQTVIEADRRREAASAELRTIEAEAARAARSRRPEPQEPPRGRVAMGSAGAEAVEWYVLARLAQQRSVSFVGSVPIVVDDAFSAWSIDELRDVFERLERMSEVIQIVMLTDDADISAWARSLGSTRASVLDLRSTVPVLTRPRFTWP